MDNYPDMGIREVRKDRKPKDSSNSEDIVVNGYLKDNKLPLRSKALFGSTDEGVAMSYGEEYLIFPKGNFKSVYFDKVDDVYGNIFVKFNSGEYWDVRTGIDVALEDNIDFLYKEYGKKEIDNLLRYDMFWHMAQDIVKGMKVEDAMWKYLDRVEEIYRSIPNWEEEWTHYHEEADGIAQHAEKFFWRLLDGGYKVNDIMNSNGKELIIDCKEYYFMRATGTVEYNGLQIRTKSLAEKELGLIER
jgi:hypothetical protein